MSCDDHGYGEKKSRIRGETVMEPGLIFLYSVIRRDLSEKVKFGNLIRNLTDEEKAFQFEGRAST